MRRSTRNAFARLAYLLSVDDCGAPKLCACHRPIDRRLSPEQRKALDALEEAMQGEVVEAEPLPEPSGHWIRHVETD